MAVRLIALYNHPDDPAAFDAHYRDVHGPIVRRYPGLRDLRLTRADGLGGRPPAFYLVAEMTLTDPVFYTKPVTAEKRWAEVPNGHLLPYECAEEAWNIHLEKLAEKRK